MSEVEREIRLVALDLDGTVVGDNLIILPRVKEAVAAAQARGVRVILATGRMFSSSLPFARELGIAGPYIAYNGALVMDAEGQIHLSDPVPKPLVHEVIDLAEREGMTLNLYVDDRLCVAEMNDDVEFYNTIAQVEPRIVGDLRSFVDQLRPDQDVHKALIIAEPDHVARLQPQVEEEYEGRLEAVMSRDRFIEMTGAGVSKGRTLARLCEAWGIRPEEVLAVGDHFNDVTMLRFAGVGAAMGNAPEAVKAVADFVVGTVHEGGVADAIERFVLAG